MEAGWSDASAGRAAWPEVDVLEGLTAALADHVAARSTLTGEHLAAYVGT